MTSKILRNYSKSRIYIIWKSMIQRCNNPKHMYYHLYGGAGVKVCKRWLSFDKFLLDMIPGYSDDLTLDRINSKRGYNKKNCKWSTVAEQNKNRRNTRLENIDGVDMTLMEISKTYGISYHTLATRWCAGKRGFDLLKHGERLRKKTEEGNSEAKRAVL